ncbi:MAG TPA: hypothetical protein VMH82_19240, partial [Myxococcota bacterium]|nr:hypothetical protein [Myxococcota bacterium]
MELIGGSRRSFGHQALKGEFQVRERGRIDEIAQLLLAEQLAQQIPIQGKSAGPALGERSVAFVHVRGEVVEQERARERRGRDRLDLPDFDVAPRHALEDVAERRQIEQIREAFAVRLDDDREASVSARDREQPGRPLALLPERGSGTRAAPR